MKSKLLVALILTMATMTSAFAAKSATTPLSGTYNASQSQFCTSDVSSPLPSNTSFSYIDQSAGFFTFIPDSVQLSFNAWVTSIVGKGFINPSSFINVTQDPTAAVGVKLAETPIQWGTINVNRSDLQSSFPFTKTPVISQTVKTNQFFITSFNYAFPANNNNVKTGYRIYTISVGDNNWGAIRDMYFITNPSTKILTSATGVDFYQTTMPVNGSNYLFDCTDNFHLTL